MVHDPTDIQYSTGSQYWFYINSDNGLVPSGTKLLLEPILTKVEDATGRH